MTVARGNYIPDGMEPAVGELWEFGMDEYS